MDISVTMDIGSSYRDFTWTGSSCFAWGYRLPWSKGYQMSCKWIQMDSNHGWLLWLLLPSGEVRRIFEWGISCSRPLLCGEEEDEEREFEEERVGEEEEEGSVASWGEIEDEEGSHPCAIMPSSTSSPESDWNKYQPHNCDGWHIIITCLPPMLWLIIYWLLSF